MYCYEIYVKNPTPFIIANWKQLLPDWQKKPQSMAIILLKSKFALDHNNALIIQEKDQLLREFLRLGEKFKILSHQQKLVAEVISPKDGKPHYSNPGKLIFDLIAIINYSLGFNFYSTIEGCKVLNHPIYGTAIYPGIFLYQGNIEELQTIINNIK